MEIELVICLPNRIQKKIDFCTYLMFISCCKDHSVPLENFNKTIEMLASDGRKIIQTSYLKFNHVLSYKAGGYYKGIFTPSLINFLKSKLKLEKDYNLEYVLKNKFEKENFVEVEEDNLDLHVILYRLCFESYISIPHKKGDIVKLFQTTKFVLPEDYKDLEDGNTDIVCYKFLNNLQYLMPDGKSKLGSVHIKSESKIKAKDMVEIKIELSLS